MALKHLGKVDWQELQNKSDITVGQYHIYIPFSVTSSIQQKRRNEQRRRKKQREKIEENRKNEEEKKEEEKKEEEKKEEEKKEDITSLYKWLGVLESSTNETPCNVKGTFSIMDMKEKVLTETQRRPWIDQNKTQFFLYKSNLFTFTPSDTHSIEERKLLIAEHFLKKETRFAKIKEEIELFKNLQELDLSEARRKSIPEKVQFIVWRRDEGKCLRCGSSKNLEYDHIIPVSKGGSNTVKNVQLLCEKCNRRKSAKI